MNNTIVYVFCSCKAAEFYSLDKTKSEKRIEELCSLRQFPIVKCINAIWNKYPFMSAKGIEEFINLALTYKKENPHTQIIFVIDNLLLFHDYVNDRDFNSLQILGRVVDTLTFQTEVEAYLDLCVRGGFPCE